VTILSILYPCICPSLHILVTNFLFPYYPGTYDCKIILTEFHIPLRAYLLVGEWCCSVTQWYIEVRIVCKLCFNLANKVPK